MIEQAKGVLAQRGHTDVQRAFSALRAYARRHRVRLHHLASRVTVDDQLADEVLDNDAR